MIPGMDETTMQYVSVLRLSTDITRCLVSFDSSASIIPGLGHLYGRNIWGPILEPFEVSNTRLRIPALRYADARLGNPLMTKRVGGGRNRHSSRLEGEGRS